MCWRGETPMMSETDLGNRGARRSEKEREKGLVGEIKG